MMSQILALIKNVKGMIFLISHCESLQIKVNEFDIYNYAL